MAKEKLNNLKRFIYIRILHILLNIRGNLVSILLSLLYINFFLMTAFFGLWKSYGFIWHLFVLLLYASLLFLLLIYFFKNYKHYKINYTLLWIEKKNFKHINPLNALKDMPAEKNYNKNIWQLHKLSTIKNLRNIKFYFPVFSINSKDPLKTRFLILLIFFVSFYWAQENNKILSNLKGLVNFDQYNYEKDIFNLKVWIEPPVYTGLDYKYINSSNLEKNKIKELVPVNSYLNVLVNSEGNNFNIVSSSENIKIDKFDKYNYKTKHKIKENQTLLFRKNNNDFLKIDFNIIKDRNPKIVFLSEPSSVNDVALSFVTKATDDYGVKEINLYINKSKEYEHFIEENIKYSIHTYADENIDNKLVESYFYKYLSDIIWAGSKTTIDIEVKDFAEQSFQMSDKLILPIKSFNNDLANDLMSLRNKIARNKISIKIAKEKFLDLFFDNKELLEDPIIKDSYEKVLLSMKKEKVIVFSIHNNFFKILYELAEKIEETYTYLAKKNLEQVEQNLYDSIKQKETDKISNNSKIFKDNIESLLNLENKNNAEENKFQNRTNERIREEIKKLTQQIEDLLKAGSSKEVNKKVQQLKQLSESIKNPNKNQESLNQSQKRKEFINKLSELLNEQEKVMEETFHRAADRGKFKQSSEGSGGKSPKNRQEELRNTLGNVMREIGASENEIPQELGRADRAMRQASRDLDNGRPDDAASAQGRALEMIQRSINRINAEEFKPNAPQLVRKGNKESRGNEQKEYMSENENIEYQGTSSGGRLIIPEERKIKSARKIADELYDRYNQEYRSSKDKKYIGDLLNWY